jgi:hypothetical protein
MKTKQIEIDSKSISDLTQTTFECLEPNFVLIFASVGLIENKSVQSALRASFKNTVPIIGCSTAGEISSNGVSDEKMIITAVEFKHPNFKTAKYEMKSMADSKLAGEEIGKTLSAPNLSSVLLFGQGVNINGSELVTSLKNILGEGVIITGGLAGDGGKFQKTYTILNGEYSDENIVALGIYDKNIKVHFGSMGGWEPFGPARKVTKSAGNILFELDHKPALPLYKEYLGDEAKGLPGTGLLFPLALLKNDLDSYGLIRTILAVNEADNSLTFAGDVPLGSTVKLMHAPNENLIDGAKNAAESAKINSSGGLAILISCVGRKLVLGTDTEDEIDAVKNVFGKNVTYTGFYSYGEICPQYTVADCKLHNQTMTITYLNEDN